VGRDRGERRARLLVLGAGPAQLGLLAAARGRGLWVVAADRDPAAPGFELADRRALVSTEDEEAIGRLAQAERVDGIVAPGIDWPVGVAARTAARLGLPHPIDPETARLATSKQHQRRRLEEAGVPQPRSALVGSTEALHELALRPPCVVKAPDLQGQRGLHLVSSGDGLVDAVEAALAASRGGAALVEELADGPELTVNAFSVGGAFHPLTVTDRLTAEPPAFGVALAHAWPASSGAAAAVEAARSAAEAIGLRDGPSYIQVRVGRDGARVIELAARLGGGHDAELCELALGVDLNGLALAAALGEPVRAGDLEVAPRHGGACVRFLVAPPGRLRAVTGADDARAAPGVRDVRFYRRPGHVFEQLRRGADRAGAILATGGSRDEALARADAAAARVSFDVARADEPALS
jgi:biotin carboxylase